MTKTSRFDAAEYLTSEADYAAYLEAALEENDPEFFVKALGTVARACGMTKIARDAGLSRESLYKALSGTGNPQFVTIAKVMKAIGVKLSIQVA